MCDCNQEFLSEFKKHCDEQIKINRAMMSSFRRSIPTYLTKERSWQANSSSITLLPQSHNLELITAIFVYITAPGGGTLQLGQDRVLTFQQGFFPLYGLSLLLNENDPRILTQGTSGAMALELFGQELLDRGPF